SKEARAVEEAGTAHPHGPHAALQNCEEQGVGGRIEVKMSMRRHHYRKAVGARANGALLRCGKPARHAPRNDRGKALAWLCREHHRGWTKYVGGLLSNERRR